VGRENRPRTGKKEGARKTGQALSPDFLLRTGSSRVTSGKNHEIGIELKMKNLTGIYETLV
jgi:hypothetical protein